MITEYVMSKSAIHNGRIYGMAPSAPHFGQARLCFTAKPLNPVRISGSETESTQGFNLT